MPPKSTTRLRAASYARAWYVRAEGLVAADRWAQVLRMELQVYADNARAIALYESLGFVREGLHRGYALRDGAYVDSLSMARMHPNPPRIAA